MAVEQGRVVNAGSGKANDKSEKSLDKNVQKAYNTMALARVLEW